MNSCVEVAIALPIDKLFHYSIPEHLRQEVAIGKRVRVPFQNRTEIGCIAGLAEKPEFLEIKPVNEIIDKEPILNEEMLKLTKWMSDSYFCSWGEAIAATIPSPLRRGKISIRQRVAKSPEAASAPPVKPTEPLKLTEEQKKALETIGASLDKDEFRTFLLHGITSSGKTEVYLQAIDWTLKKSRSAIVLVPEISLTPQTIERF